MGHIDPIAKDTSKTNILRFASISFIIGFFIISNAYILWKHAGG